MTFFYNFVDDTMTTIAPMGPITEDEDIAKKIFSHLQMFQYLDDLRQHDEKIWSTFKSHSVKLNDKINVEFLRKWDEKMGKLGEGNAKHWDFKEQQAIHEKQFVEFYVKDVAEDDDVFGGRGLIQSMALEVILFSYNSSIKSHD